MSLANEITLESSGSRRSFFNHVFSTTEEGKGEDRGRHQEGKGQAEANSCKQQFKIIFLFG